MNARHVEPKGVWRMIVAMLEHIAASQENSQEKREEAAKALDTVLNHLAQQ